MKKTLLLVAAGLLGASLSMDAAKVYFDNEGTGWSSVYGYSWGPDYQQELPTETVDGHTLYVAELNNSEIIFRSTLSEWAGDKQTENLPVIDGAVYGKGSIKNNGGSTESIAQIVDGKYVSGEAAYSNKFSQVYLVGDMAGSGWNENTTSYPLELKDGSTNTYTGTYTMSGKNYIKVKAGAVFGTGGEDVNIELGKENDLLNTGNAFVLDNDTEAAYTFTVVLDQDAKKGSFTVSAETAPVNYTPVYFLSDRYNFEPRPVFRMSTTNGEVYTLNIPDAGSDVAFKFMAVINGENKYFSNGMQNMHNETYTITGNVERNMTFHTGGDVTLTLKPINNFNGGIEVTITGQDHDADNFPPIYLIGEFTNWEAEEAYRLHTEDGVNYTISVPNMSGDAPFKFLGDDPHGYEFTNGKQNMADGDYELIANATGDMTLRDGGDVTFNFVLGEMHSTATLTISGQNVVEDEFPRMYFVGERTNWIATETYRMETTNGQVYTITVPDIVAKKQFRFTGDSWDIRSMGGTGLTNLGNVEVELKNSQSNLSLVKGGNVTFTLTFPKVITEEDVTIESATLKIEGQEINGDEPVEPETKDMYLIDESTNWVEGSGIKMDYADGVYTLTTNLEAGKEFKFYGGTWGERELTMNDGMALEDGEYTLTTIPFVNMALKTGGNVTFTLVPNADFSSAQLTIAGQTGGDVPPVVDPTEPEEGAPLYATGEGEFANGAWNAANPDQFEYADGKYTLTVKDLTQLKISTTKTADPEDTNGWDAFNKGVLGCNYGETPGVAVALIAGSDANIAAPWKGDYTITVAGDLSTITLSTDTPEPTGSTPIYLRGDMNGWDADDDWKMEEVTEGTVWKFECAEGQSIAAGEAFKIADADWNKYNFGGDGKEIKLDKLAHAYQGSNSNFTLTEECNGVIYLNLDVNGEAFIVLSNDKNFVPNWNSDVEDPELPETLYIIGQVNGNGWNPSLVTPLAKGNTGGVFTLANVKVEGENGVGMFYFCTQIGADETDWNGLGDRYQDANGDGGVMRPTEGLIAGRLVKNPEKDAAFAVTNGVYDITVDIKNMTLFMDVISQEQPESPETLYVIGNVNGYTWNPTQGVKLEEMEPGSGYFIGEDIKILNMSGGENNFSFCTKLGENEEDWAGLGTRYGNFNTGEGILEPDEEGEIMCMLDPTKPDNAFVVPAGIYSMMVSPAQGFALLMKTGEITIDEYPENLYIIGNVNGYTWNPTLGVKMENLGDGKYMVENVDINDGEKVKEGDVAKGLFSFCTQLSSDEENWEGLGTRYGNAAGDAVMLTTDALGNADGSLTLGDPAFAVPAAKYVVEVNLKDMSVKMTKSGETGISSINADDADAIYFNLQGLQVKNPESGLYIKVTNGKSEKVLVK